MSFVIYDLETTGTSSRFDQILEFAAVQTDDSLEQLDVLETSSRLLPFVIPAPRALATNGLSIATITDASRQSHYAMMMKVLERFDRWCPTTFMGFNSIRFDEEFLRHALYQCLMTPYVTNSNGCSRADILSLARAFAAFYPDRMTIPLEGGRPTFRLKAFAMANGFPDFEAHQALADVRAALHICRIVRRDAPDLWSNFLRFSSKQSVVAFLKDEPALLLFEASSRRASFCVTVIGACRKPGMGNTHYALDLTTDAMQLQQYSEGQLRDVLVAHPEIIRKIKVNTAPLLCAIADAPEHMLNGCGEDELMSVGEAVQSDRAFISRLLGICEAMEKEWPKSIHVEEQLYDGFFPDADRIRMGQFHEAIWEDRGAIASSFQDRRLQQLSRRLRFVERADLIEPLERQKLSDGIRDRLYGKTGEEKWLTVPRAHAELASVRAELGNLESLHGYEDYLNGL